MQENLKIFFSKKNGTLYAVKYSNWIVNDTWNYLTLFYVYKSYI